MCAAIAAGGHALAMLLVPIRRCGGGGARGLECYAEVVIVVASFFEFFHLWVSPSAPKSHLCLGFTVVADNLPGAR